MIVTLDGQRVTQEFESGVTLQTVIDSVKANQAGDCMVVGVALDGEECSDGQIGELLQQPLNCQQVDLESGQPAELAAMALQTIAGQLKSVGSQQEAIADKLNAGQTSEAIKAVSEFVRAWQLVYQVISQVSQLTGQDLTAAEYDGQPIAGYVDELLERLVEIKSALESQDTVLLADLIRYETPPLCETWHSILLNLADQVAAGKA